MKLQQRLRTHLRDYAAAVEAADRIDDLEARLASAEERNRALAAIVHSTEQERNYANDRWLAAALAVGAEPATVRSSGPAEQDSNSRVWTAGIDAERSYPGAEPSLHLNAIEFHHMIRGEAEATRDRWLAAALATGAEPGK